MNFHCISPIPGLHKKTSVFNILLLICCMLWAAHCNLVLLTLMVGCMRGTCSVVGWPEHVLPALHAFMSAAAEVPWLVSRSRTASAQSGDVTIARGARYRNVAVSQYYDFLESQYYDFPETSHKFQKIDFLLLQKSIFIFQTLDFAFFRMLKIRFSFFISFIFVVWGHTLV